MCEVDPLGRQFARRALGETAQAELADREARGVGEALDAGGGAGEEDRALAQGKQPPGRLLDHQEAAIGGHLDRAAHLFGIEIDNRPAYTAAGVVDHDFGYADPRLRSEEHTSELQSLMRI